MKKESQMTISSFSKECDFDKTNIKDNFSTNKKSLEPSNKIEITLKKLLFKQLLTTKEVQEKFRILAKEKENNE